VSFVPLWPRHPKYGTKGKGHGTYQSIISSINNSLGKNSIFIIYLLSFYRYTILCLNEIVMKQFKPLQILTLSIFILLLSGFVAYKSGVFDRSANSQVEIKNVVQTNITQTIPVNIDTPTKLIDTPKINPRLLSSSKSMIIVDKSLIKYSLLEQIKIEDSISKALYSNKIDTAEIKKSLRFNYMGTSKSGIIFTPEPDVRIQYNPKSDPFNLRPDTLEQ
jgi:hypothetical protein